MKVINEAKQEALPLDFITSFVSKGWDEVGILKASIDSIKRDFKDTKKVEEILSDLMDAYLVCISRLQAYMDKKDYIEMPEDKKLAEDLASEDLLIKGNMQAEIKHIDDDKEIERPTEGPVIDEKPTVVEKPIIDDEDQFEYFCDFDEIKPSAEKIDVDEAFGLK